MRLRCYAWSAPCLWKSARSGRQTRFTCGWKTAARRRRKNEFTETQLLYRQGPVRGMHISLGTAGSFTFETTGTAANLASGWALLSQPNTDSVGIFAVFRQSIAGRQSQEAVVPSVNQFESHFVLPYDNTQFVTGIALANPTLNRVV